MFKNCVFAAVLVAFLASCAGAAEVAEKVEKVEKVEKKGILLVAFGTSMPEATGAIESLVSAAKSAFPDTEVRLAYTSNIIRRKLKKERGIEIPTPPEALARMNDERFSRVYVQPMHVIPGEEYDDLKSVVDAFASMKGKYGFPHIALGQPFLSNESDCELMAGILARHLAGQGKFESNKAVVLMGHGTPHMANAMYSAMQGALSRLSDPAVSGRIFLGTVESTPTFDDVLAALKKTRVKSLVLAPFMIVAGDHANNDLAGADDPESWLSLFKKEGYEVEPYLVGLGQYPEIAKLFVKRIEELVE
ncbi:MAG: sirohydrochlorin cobaltochelatase [Synergistaceae bacterium]|jgi:sirohydrochlorin cobaltochelatase|nr:sirohydrochlorin cobaltochelatase [Synergistaceae bacterium]